MTTCELYQSQVERCVFCKEGRGSADEEDCKLHNYAPSRMVGAFVSALSHSTVDESVCPPQTYTFVELFTVNLCVAHRGTPFPLQCVPYLLTALTTVSNQARKRAYTCTSNIRLSLFMILPLNTFRSSPSHLLLRTHQQSILKALLFPGPTVVIARNHSSLILQVKQLVLENKSCLPLIPSLTLHSLGNVAIEERWTVCKRREVRGL